MYSQRRKLFSYVLPVSSHTPFTKKEMYVDTMHLSIAVNKVEHVCCISVLRKHM